MVDGSGAGPDGSRGRRVEHADAWEVEREHLVVALHDRLRNPLACLQGYVELLLDGVAGPVAAEQQVLLERVRAATARLTTAVEEIVPRAEVREE